MKKVIKGIVLLIVLAIGFVGISNYMMIKNSEKRICDVDTLKAKNADCILILGAGVWEGNKPSPMLKDRLDKGLSLYQEGVSTKILVSGDHGTKEYDEVNVMKNYLIDAGVNSEDIFMDHAGFSTYESMYRARDIFGVKSMIVVTQKYHMYRSLYICDKLGIDALGSDATTRLYAGQSYRDFREMIARDKDILTCMMKVKPTYLGETIDIHGNGDVTND